MTKSPYIIMAPPYRHNSGGVRALHELRNLLEKRGYEAKVFQGGQAPPEAIVVYPEVVCGNPMNGKTVVRWVLNFPGLLGGDKEYDPKEIIFTYLPRFFPGAKILTVPIVEDFYRDEGLPRSGSYFWVGKGVDVPLIPETEGLEDITCWELNRKELAKFLNEIGTLYIYDDATMLTVEARRCGCKVILIPDEPAGPTYEELIKDFEAQLDEFIRVTQAEAGQKLKISFGVMVNDPLRLDMCLKQSELPKSIKCHTLHNPDSATKGLNKLLGLIEAECADVAVLTHQDMFFLSGWLPQVKEQIAKLPDSWVVAGIIGKDTQGRIAGQFRDMRIPAKFNTKHIHEFPQPACCMDECCIIVNLKKGFRFDETMEGFDLYGTLCVLQTWEMGGTAWILDAYAEHYCMRKFDWYPSDLFVKNFKRLYDRFTGIRVDSTALGLPEDGKLTFETSAA
jgi:hypothetical protein